MKNNVDLIVEAVKNQMVTPKILYNLEKISLREVSSLRTPLWNLSYMEVCRITQMKGKKMGQRRAY